jgi:hypothetical protein
VLLAAVFTACGDDAPDMSTDAATRLQTEVAAIRDAIDSGDDAAATAQLASLRTTVVELVGTNGITPDRAIVINAAIARLEGELAGRAATTTTSGAPTTTASAVPVVTVPSTTTTSTTTSTTTTAPASEGKGKPGKGKGDKDSKDD